MVNLQRLDNSIVVDNNIIQDLFELHSLGVLFSSFELVIIPRSIYEDEMMEDVKKGISSYKYSLNDITNDEGLETYNSLTNTPEYKRLSTYDKIAISIAKEKHVYCNSNEALIRKACANYNVDSFGILGLFKIAYERKVIDLDEVINLSLELLKKENSCYIKESIVDDFIKEMNKLP